MNLIGEHTDYSLLPVMPLAIDRHLAIWAAATADGRLIAESIEFEGRIEFELDAPPSAPGGWHRYLAAAAAALAERRPRGAGARLLVGGDLPSTGGLSSSSALSVGVIATLARVWGIDVAADELPGLAISAERSIGVEGGMMDQTVIALARAGHALRIDFDPPATRGVPIPADLSIVAAYSGTPAPKGGAANLAYNTRVVACRAAALLLGVPHGLDVADPPVLSKVVAAGLADADALPETTTADDVAATLGVNVERVVSMTAGRFDPAAELPVRIVARHVIGEAARVDRAEEALRDGSLERLGALLDASHASLRAFGASSPALDALVAAMRSAGAWGARLTGAGFGGYAVAVCAPDATAAVIGAARSATGGPAFEVIASDGVG